MRHPLLSIAVALLLTMPVVMPIVAVACAPDMSHHAAEREHCPPMEQHEASCCFLTADTPLLPVTQADVRVQPTVQTFSDDLPVHPAHLQGISRTPNAPPPRPQPLFLLDRVMLL